MPLPLQGSDWHCWCRPSGCTHGQSVETNGLLEDHLVARFVNMDYLSFSLVTLVLLLLLLLLLLKKTFFCFVVVVVTASKNW